MNCKQPTLEEAYANGRHDQREEDAAIKAELLAVLKEAECSLSLMLSYHGPMGGDYVSHAQHHAQEALPLMAAAIAKAEAA